MKTKFYKISNPRIWCTTMDNIAPNGYTDIRPLGWIFYPDLPNQHFDTNTQEWILDDDCPERQVLDKLICGDALEIRRIFRQLPSNKYPYNPSQTLEDDLDWLLSREDKYENEWNTTPHNLICLDDPTVQEAMTSYNFEVDIDKIKRIILGLEVL